MLTFTEAKKRDILAQLRAHREADQLVKGVYWEDGKGCAVGCIAHQSGDTVHAVTAEMLGVPYQITHLIDAIFEGLPNDEAMAWPERVVGAIPCGANASLVWPRFAVRLLIDPGHGVVNTTDDAKARALIEAVARCYQRRIDGDEPSEREWREVGDIYGDASAARAARAVWAARDARDAREARAAGAAWDAGAARAARAVGAGRAAGAARAVHWRRCADWLVDILASLKPEAAKRN